MTGSFWPSVQTQKFSVYGPFFLARPVATFRRRSSCWAVGGDGGWTPWAGDLPHRMGGAMVADRLGQATGYALDNLQQRGELFIAPGDIVYEGMVIGESARSEDMVVNAVRAKEKTNMRTHSHDEGVKLAAPHLHTLETAVEFIADDELVEVTPTAVRIRKRLLTEADRRRAYKRALV